MVPKSSQNGPKIVPTSSQIGQDRPRWRKMPPRWLEENRKWPQDSPRWPPNGLRWLQDGFKCPKMAPRWLKMAPKWHKPFFPQFLTCLRSILGTFLEGKNPIKSVKLSSIPWFFAISKKHFKITN